MMRRLLVSAGLIALACLFSPSVLAEDNPLPPHAVLWELPINQVRPEGWLRQYLVNQRDGLTGHLENGGYPFDGAVWVGENPSGFMPGGDAWWPYEQNAYWIDGMVRCGILLQDDFLLAKARRSLNHVLSHPAPSGYLGPDYNPDRAKIYQWIHAVLFRAVMADHMVTRDPAVPTRLRAHYLAGENDYARNRDTMNLEPMLWTYARTGDAALLALAEQAYALSEAKPTQPEVSAPALLRDQPVHEHGVTYDERMKLGALLYLYTGKEEYLRPSLAAFRKLAKYHLLVSGVNVSSEYTEPLTTVETAETCDVSDFTWATGYLCMATGDATYADAIERAMFNAAPGCTAADFKSFQYFSGPNQILGTHTGYPRTGKAETAFGPNAHVACCAGNVSRAMPNYVARMWLTDQAGALVAAMYGPSRITHFNPQDGAKVEVREETGYPFSEEIAFLFQVSAPTKLPFRLRIPGWCRAAQLTVNGVPIAVPAKAGTFVTIEREFRTGDRVALKLPQEIALEPGPAGTVSVVRGPLVYSLRIEQDWTVHPDPVHSTKDFPAYDVTAKSPWNYALVLDQGRLPGAAEIIRRPPTDSPWSLDTAPLEIRVRARRVRNWGVLHSDTTLPMYWETALDPQTGKPRDWTPLERLGQAGKYAFTPPVPTPDVVAANLSPEEETVTLVPYGAAKLRITYFPTSAPAGK